MMSQAIGAYHLKISDGANNYVESGAAMMVCTKISGAACSIYMQYMYM